MANITLHFINTAGPALPDDEATRAFVRQRAAISGAAFRKKRRKPNLSSSKSINGSRNTSKGDSKSSRDAELDASEEWQHTRLDESHLAAVARYTSRRMLVGPLNTLNVSKYELARSKYGTCLTQLSVLTQWNLGEMTVQSLARDPGQLKSLLDSSRWSYLQFVPQYYGQHEALTAAADCLMYRTNKMLQGQRGLDVTLQETKLNSKALQSLQTALQDPHSCLQAETLCASSLLCLCELLEPSADRSWNNHVSGIAKMIQHRGAACFLSEFDLALFAASVGPTVAEALAQDRHTYLDAPEWADCYRSMGQSSEEASTRSLLTLQIRVLTIVIPGLFHDLRHLSTNSDRDSLLASCLDAHNSALSCLEALAAQATQHLTPEQKSLHRENRGAALSGLIVLKRFLCTLSEAKEDQLQYETDAQALSMSVLDRNELPPSKYSFLAAAYELGVALSVLATGSVWLADIALSNEQRRAIAQTRYRQWVGLLETGHSIDDSVQICPSQPLPEHDDGYEALTASLFDLD